MFGALLWSLIVANVLRSLWQSCMALVLTLLALTARKVQPCRSQDDVPQAPGIKNCTLSMHARAGDCFSLGLWDTIHRLLDPSDGTTAGSAMTREALVLSTALFAVPLILLMCVLLLRRGRQRPVNDGVFTVKEVTGTREGLVVCKLDLSQTNPTKCNVTEGCPQKDDLYLGKCENRGADPSSAPVAGNGTPCGVVQGSTATAEGEEGTSKSPPKAVPEVFVLTPRALPEVFALTPRKDVKDAAPKAAPTTRALPEVFALTPRTDIDDVAPEAAHTTRALPEVFALTPRMDIDDAAPEAASHKYSGEAKEIPEPSDEWASPDDQGTDQLQESMRRESSKRRRIRTPPALMGCLGGCSVAISSVGDAPAAMMERHGHGACCLPVTCAAVVTGIFYSIVVGVMHGIYSAIGEEPIQVTLERGSLPERVLPTIVENEELED